MLKFALGGALTLLLCGCLGAAVDGDPALPIPRSGDWFEYEDERSSMSFRATFLGPGVTLDSASKGVPSVAILFEVENGPPGPRRFFEHIDPNAGLRISVIRECRTTYDACPDHRIDVNFVRYAGAGFMGLAPFWGRPLEEFSTTHTRTSPPPGVDGTTCTTATPKDPVAQNHDAKAPFVSQMTKFVLCRGLPAPRVIEFDRQTFVLTGHGQTAPPPRPAMPNLAHFTSARDQLKWAHWDQMTPPLGPAFEAIAHDEAVRWLAANNSTYQEFVRHNPKSIVTRSFYTDGARGLAVGRSFEEFDRTLTVQDITSGKVLNLTVVKRFETVLGQRLTTIRTEDQAEGFLPVHYDRIHAPDRLVTFHSAHAWADKLLTFDRIHSSYVFVEDTPGRPTYRFNYLPSTSETLLSFPFSIWIDSQSGLLKQVNVPAGSWA